LVIFDAAFIAFLNVENCKSLPRSLNQSVRLKITPRARRSIEGTAMKIQLERKLSSCPNQLTCAVCRQAFPAQSIRALLFSDRGLLQGDICAHCRQSGSEAIRETLHERVILLKRQSEFGQSTTIAIHELLTELTACAQEGVKFPSLLDWWLKWWEVFWQESQELEAARLGLSHRDLAQRAQLERQLMAKDPE
jgi:hypothetical protein